MTKRFSGAGEARRAGALQEQLWDRERRAEDLAPCSLGEGHRLPRLHHQPDEQSRSLLAVRGIAQDTAPRSPVGLYGGQLAEAVALLATQAKGELAIREALSMISWARNVTAATPSPGTTPA